MGSRSFAPRATSLAGGAFRDRGTAIFMSKACSVGRIGSVGISGDDPRTEFGREIFEFRRNRFLGEENECEVGGAV